MRIPRIYHPELITAGREIALSDDAANHVAACCAWAQPLRRFSCLTAPTGFSTRKLRGRIKACTSVLLRGEIDDRESPAAFHLGR